SALYIRATLASTAEGGMPTHIAGFASGAAALGHRLRFLTSDVRAADFNWSVAPSLGYSATRVLFELWNNLVFTAEALRLIIPHATQSDDIDFIYPRYSRFTWTGAVLALTNGIPVAVE